MLSELIVKHYDKLNKNDLYLCQFISTHKKECSSLTIEELAAKSHISRSSILRFAQKLSLRGYSELKVYLKLDVEQERPSSLDVLTEVCDDYHRAIEDFKSRNCDKICRILYEAGRIFVYATGSMQASVGRELQRKFLYAKKCIYTSEGTGEFKQIIDIACKEDVIIMISLSGDSEEALACSRQIKMRGIPLIALTKMKVNGLARISDESLYAGTSVVASSVQDNYETSMLFFMLTEILLVKYMLYKEAREKEAGEKEN